MSSGSASRQVGLCLPLTAGAFRYGGLQLLSPLTFLRAEWESVRRRCMGREEGGHCSKRNLIWITVLGLWISFGSGGGGGGTVLLLCLISCSLEEKESRSFSEPTTQASASADFSAS